MGVIEEILRLKDEATPALRKTSKEAAATKKQMDLLRSSVMVASAAFAAGSAIIIGTAAAIFKTAGAVADLRNELVDMSTRTGAAASTLQGLRLAARGTGEDLSKAEAGLRGFQQRILAAERGTAEATEAFEKYGIKIRDSEGNLRSMDDLLIDVSATLAGISDPTEKSLASMDLMGRSGQSLMQIFGGTELSAWVAQAKLFGADVGPEAAEAASQWQQSMALLQTSWEGLKDEVAGGAVLTTITEKMDDLADSVLVVRVLFASLRDGIIAAFTEPLEPFRRMLAIVSAVPKALASGDLAEVGRLDVALGKAIQDAADIQLGGVTGLDAQLGLVIKGAFADAATAVRQSGNLRGDIRGAGAGGSGGVTPNVDGTKGKPIWVDIDPDGDFADELESLGDGFELGEATLARIKADALEVARKAAEHARTLQAINVGTMAATGDLTGLLSLAGPQGAIASAVVSGLREVGQLGAAGVGGKLNSFTDDIVAGLEALPEILSDVLPSFIADSIPVLITALVEAWPRMVVALIQGQAKLWASYVTEIPQRIIEGIWNAGVRLVQKLIDFFANLLTGGLKKAFGGDGNGIFGQGGIFETDMKNKGERSFLGVSLKSPKKFRTGGYVDRTQMALLHQGERVVPADGGAPTGDLSALQGGGMTIVANGVMASSVDEFIREINRHLGARGRGLSLQGVT